MSSEDDVRQPPLYQVFVARRELDKIDDRRLDERTARTVQAGIDHIDDAIINATVRDVDATAEPRSEDDA